MFEAKTESREEFKARSEL